MAWISYINVIDQPAAVIYAPIDPPGDLAVTNLLRRQGFAAWRTIKIGDNDEPISARFTVGFGRIREIDVLALVFPRIVDPTLIDATPPIAASDTVRHLLGFGPPSYEPTPVTPDAPEVVYDSGEIEIGADPLYGYHALKLASTVSATWWQCTITAPSRNSEGFLDVARAWAGPAFSTRRGFSAQSIAVTSNATQASAQFGLADYIEAGPGRAVWQLDYSNIGNAERPYWEDLERYVQQAHPVLIGEPAFGRQGRDVLIGQIQTSGIDRINSVLSRRVLRVRENL